jgi:dGTPase
VGGDLVDRREARRSAGRGGAPADLAASPFRADRDRIVASPFFARLGGVTQVVSASGSALLHNRLTHSLKVAVVARAIVERFATQAEIVPVLDKLGGCDPDVVEAAALAHDLGHPPFGHLGEQVLDRLARQRFHLADGFEGNAQSFRIVTTTDTRGPGGRGLDLTAAVRAAMLKYPWTRLPLLGASPQTPMGAQPPDPSFFPEPHPRALPKPPRGAAEPAGEPGSGSSKFSAYVSDLDDLVQAREPFAGRIADWQQTVEASVMDTADDIAYAIHDLEDFHRIGVLQHAPVSAELGQWLAGALDFAGLDDAELAASSRRPGRSLEELRRHLHRRDSWIVDDDAFVAAVARVRTELVDDLLATPFDGSVEAEQAVGRFSARWTARLVAGIGVIMDPPTRSGHVVLAPAQWHEVQVLKFVHKRFVLLRPDLALHQRGQARLVSSLVAALDEWLRDRYEAVRLPRRLHDLAELAAAEYPTRELAEGRAVIDFVASLTDGQTVALLDALSGRGGAPWSDAFVL